MKAETMIKRQTLCDNEWLSLKIMKAPELGIDGYVYSHEERCNGNIVAILPYRFSDKGIEYLLRHEVTPCWHPTDKIISCITGGVDHKLEGKSFYDELYNTIIEEVEQEAGYIITAKRTHYLGISFGTKSTDTIYHLIAVDLTGLEKTGDAKGDGSELEEQAYCEWYDEIGSAQEPFVYMLFYKFNKYFNWASVGLDNG